MLDLSVLHLGAARYDPADRSHSTFEIWRELAKGFRRYTVLGRSKTGRACIDEGNLRVHLIESRMPQEREFLWSQRHAIRLADAVEADVVIAQSPVLGGLAGLIIKKRRKVGLLAELHSQDFFGAASPGSTKWLLQRLAAPVLRRADRIRALSPRMADDVLAKYGATLRDRLVILPPRVDLAKFRPKADWASSGRLRAVMVGAVNDNKGQVRLLRLLLAREALVELWIVGDGPDLAICRELADGHPDRVRLFGRVTHDELSNILTAADALVLYSRSEATPRVILEAMAVGLPVITTNAGFCADIVADGIEGIVLGDKPDEEVLQQLERLRGDAELREGLGKAGRLRAMRDYDSIALYERYKALIAEAAG